MLGTARNVRGRVLVAAALLPIPLLLLYSHVAVPATDAWHEQRALQRTGFVPRVYTDERGEKHRYLVFVPHSPPGEKGYPVLLFLNGEGENGTDGIRQISNNLGRQIWELKATFPFLTVAPQCRKNGSWSVDSEDTQVALGILDQVLDEYRADPSRVYLTGPSSGGRGTYAIGSHFSDRFAAIAPISAFPTPGSPSLLAGKLAEANMPVWSFYNRGDIPSLVQFNREVRAELVRAGLSPMTSELNRSDHDSWNYALRNPAFYNWLLQQSRVQNTSRSSSFKIIVSPGLEEWKQQGSGVWTADDSGTLLFAPSVEVGDSMDSRLRWRHSLADFELHFDYFADDEATVKIGFSFAADPASAKALSVDIRRPELGNGGAYDPASAEWLVHADPLAQNAIRNGEWNQVRVRREGSHLTVLVNQWELLSASCELAGDNSCALSLIGENATRWRELRIRSLSASPQASAR